MWDLDAEAERLNLKLDDLSMDEKGWDRAVNVAYREAHALRTPDKHPGKSPAIAPEGKLQRLATSPTRSSSASVRAIREEAESGNAGAVAEQQRMKPRRRARRRLAW